MANLPHPFQPNATYRVRKRCHLSVPRARFEQGRWSCYRIVAYAVLPLLLTIAEAKSPHTWDNPFIMLSGGLATYGIVAWV